jgi:ribose-phosphate pyrophosphokinase
MSGMTMSSKKSLMLFSGRAFPALAAEIGNALDVTPVPTSAYEFANGEIFVRFEDSVRGSDAFVVQSVTAPVNTWIMEALLMVDALKRASAKRITVVLPFYPYARQDKKHRGREPISARLMADMLKTAGADRLMTVDLHTAQIQGFFDGPWTTCSRCRCWPSTSSACGATATWWSCPPTPDGSGWRSGGPTGWAADWPSSTSGAIPNVPNEVKVGEVVGTVAGKTCILVDDMIDTGGTITKAADLLFDNGAEDVIVTATHGVLSGPAMDRLKNSRINEVVVTNTLPIDEEQRFDGLTVLSIAPLIARAIREVFEDGSVTSLFDGAA